MTDPDRSMQSVLEVLQKAESYLERAGLETPKVDAQWLMAGTLGCGRLDLFLQHDRPLDESDLTRLRSFFKRRAAREPLQYILGYSDFHDIRLQVEPGVLIPRPETELLVDHVLRYMARTDRPRIVDLGTGSGAIALCLASALPEARVLAIDASSRALAIAKGNAESLGLRDRVSFRLGNWLEALDLEADCIVANPPYLTDVEWESAAPEVRIHEPREALVAAKDGTADLLHIIESAYARLAPGGLLALEMGINHGPVLARAATVRCYVNVDVKRDDTGRDRYLVAEKEQAL